jgi:hypothetical protein
MRVTLIPCGPAANESERKAFEYLKARLASEPQEGNWILLTNVALSVTHRLQSDEIDLIAIGPPGVRVLELKHWTAQWFDGHKIQVEDEVDKLTNKARKVGTTLRRFAPDLPRVEGAILLTQEPSKIRRLDDRQIRGVRFHTLANCMGAVGFNNPPVLRPEQVNNLARVLQPSTAAAIDGSLKRLAGYVNLELQTPRNERFRRIYRGSHPARRDRVILYLYDLSATEDGNVETKARREFEALHRLQIYPWAPRILDSYQAAPGYAGEMFFYSVVDPAVPSTIDRATDPSWSTPERLAFALNAVRSLVELHSAGIDNEPMVHRNLTPQTILVRHDNSSIFTGFQYTRIPREISIGSGSSPPTSHPRSLAPEVQAQGLAAADQRSDVYSLCASLSLLFEGREHHP